MKYTIELCVGDIEQEGHGKVQKFKIKSNINTGMMREAYQVGSNYAGFFLTSDVGNGKHCILYDHQYWMLCKAGINVSDVLSNSLVSDGKKDKKGQVPRYELVPDDFKKLWLEIAKLGCPTLEWEDVAQQSPLYIGGYGLFK